MKTKTKAKEKSPGLRLLQHVWSHCPYNSHRQMNAAMQTAWRCVETSQLRLDVGDIAYCMKEFRAGYWFPDREDVYARACGSQHGTANANMVQVMEHYMCRKPWLREEDTKTPTRLHVGALVTWEGIRYRVTSMHDGDEPYLIGVTDGKRLRLTWEQLQEHRKSQNKRFKDCMKAIDAATDTEAVLAVQEQVRENKAKFRHWEIQELSRVFAKHTAAISQRNSAAKQLEQWLQGKDVYLPLYRDGATVHLRLRNGFVETSNGHRVPKSEAAKLLNFAIEHQVKGYSDGKGRITCDGHPLKRIDKNGVLVGCTLLTWPVITAFEPILQPA